MSAMIDLLCQQDLQDLDVTGGQLHVAEDPRALARAVATRLQTFAGTWDWDLDYGTPWPEVLAQRGSVETRIRDAVLAVLEDLVTVREVRVAVSGRAATVEVVCEEIPAPVRVEVTA